MADAPDLFDIQQEQALLGAILVRPSHLDPVRDDVGLTADDFYRDAHRRIFRHYVKIADNGTALDFGAVWDSLKRSGELEEIGGAAYLTGLTDGMPLSANATGRARTIRDYAQRRRADRVIVEARAGIHDDDDLAAILDRAVRGLLDVSQGTVQRDYVIGDALYERLDAELERLAARAVDGITGTPSGYAILDRMTTGFQPGDLIYLAARPGMGKTSAAIGITENILLQTPGAVAFFSLEMRAEQILLRLLSGISRVPLQKLRSGGVGVTSHDAVALARAQEKLRAALPRLAVDDTSQITAAEIRGKVRRMLQQQLPVSLVVIDYIGLMKPSGRRYESRVQELGQISHDLKAVAKDLGIPVMALSQLSRDSDKARRRPQLSDLRDSGELEQDADVVLFPYREGYYQETGKAPTVDLTEAEIIVAKQRDGDMGVVPMHWDGECARFSNRDFHADRGAA